MSIYKELLRYLDARRSGATLRGWYFSRRLKYLGARANIAMGLLIYDPHNISIRENFSIHRNGTLGAINGELKIGDNVSIAENVQVNANEKGRIIIGNDVAIAPNVVYT